MRYFKPVLNIIGAVALTIILFTAGVVSLQFTAAAVSPDEIEPIEISTAEDFQTIAYVINQGYINTENCYYVLTADIDLTGLYSSSAEGWKPVGFKTSGNTVAFAGVFDGAGYTVKGLWINTPDATSGSGLFGYNKGTVKNLNIIIDEAKGGITAGYYAGGVAGINDGIIENCTVTGSITADNSGGICGDNKGTVVDSVNYADINGESGIGGIAGINSGAIRFCQNIGNITSSGIYSNSGGITGNNNGEIVLCQNLGEIEAAYVVGGIAGNALAESRIITSANYASVTGRDSVGGIAGYAQGAEIRDCFNSGDIAGGENSGGIIGFCRSDITNCLNVGSVSGNAESTGGVAGRTLSGTILNSYYLQSASQAQFSDGDGSVGGIPVSVNELITRTFLDKLNDGGAVWVLRSPDDFHYYPELSALLNSELSKQAALSTIAAYKGAPVLNSHTISHGEVLSTLVFAADSEGVFVWQEPDKILNAGKNQIAYAMFLPHGNNYGEIYDIEILITVLEKPDWTLVWVTACIIGGVLIIGFALYMTDKKFKVLDRLKKIFAPKVVVERIEVVVEKPVFVEPQINTAHLSDYFEKLTPREMEVAKKILEGKTRKKIAEELGITERTAKSHIENILQKTACQNQRVFALKFKI